jgi:hypothetical protein
MLRKQKTHKKYADFINDCYSERTFSIKSMVSKHKVDAAIISTLRQEECIVSVTADTSNWIEAKPNEVMINRIIESHRQRITKYRLARQSKLKAKENQIPAPNLEWYTPPPEPITEQSAIAFLKSLGGYEIFKVERKQL